MANNTNDDALGGFQPKVPASRNKNSSLDTNNTTNSFMPSSGEQEDKSSAVEGFDPQPYGQESMVGDFAPAPASRFTDSKHITEKVKKEDSNPYNKSTSTSFQKIKYGLHTTAEDELTWDKFSDSMQEAWDVSLGVGEFALKSGAQFGVAATSNIGKNLGYLANVATTDREFDSDEMTNILEESYKAAQDVDIGGVTLQPQTDFGKVMFEVAGQYQQNIIDFADKQAEERFKRWEEAKASGNPEKYYNEATGELREVSAEQAAAESAFMKAAGEVAMDLGIFFGLKGARGTYKATKEGLQRREAQAREGKQKAKEISDEEVRSFGPSRADLEKKPYGENGPTVYPDGSIKYEAVDGSQVQLDKSSFKEAMKKEDPELTDEAIDMAWDEHVNMQRQRQQAKVDEGQRSGRRDIEYEQLGDPRQQKRAKDYTADEMSLVDPEEVRFPNTPDGNPITKTYDNGIEYEPAMMRYGEWEAVHGFYNKRVKNKETGVTENKKVPKGERRKKQEYKEYVNSFFPKGQKAKDWNGAVVKGHRLWEMRNIQRKKIDREKAKQKSLEDARTKELALEAQKRANSGKDKRVDVNKVADDIVPVSRNFGEFKQKLLDEVSRHGDNVVGGGIASTVKKYAEVHKNYQQAKAKGRSPDQVQRNQRDSLSEVLDPVLRSYFTQRKKNVSRDDLRNLQDRMDELSQIDLMTQVAREDAMIQQKRLGEPDQATGEPLPVSDWWDTVDPSGWNPYDYMGKPLEIRESRKGLPNNQERNGPQFRDAEASSVNDIASSIAKGAKDVEDFTQQFVDRTNESLRMIAGSMYEKYKSGEGETVKIRKANGSRSDAEMIETPEMPKGASIVSGDRPMIQSALEFAGGQSLTLLRQRQNLSPTLAMINDYIGTNPEMHYGPSRTGGSIYQNTMTLRGELMGRLNKVLEKFQPVTGAKTAQAARLGRKVNKKIDQEAVEFLIGNREGLSAQGRALGNELRIILDDLHQRMREAGMDVDFLENYLPRVYDMKAVRKNLEKFEGLLRKYVVDKDGFPKEAEVQQIIHNLTEGQGRMVNYVEHPSKNDLMKGRIGSKMNHLDFKRKLKDIPDEELAPFLVRDSATDLVHRYMNEVAEQVVTHEAYGKNYSKLNKMVLQAAKELEAAGKPIKDYELKRIYDIVDASNKAYNRTEASKGWRNLSKNTISFLNANILTLATFASLPEMIVPLHRSGLKAYTKALGQVGGSIMGGIAKEIHRDLGNKMQTRGNQITKDIVKAGDMAAMERLQSLFSGDFAKADKFIFRANLLHYWTQGMNNLAASAFDNMIRQDLARYKKRGNKMSSRELAEMRRKFAHYNMDLDDALQWYERGSPMDYNDPFYTNFRKGALTATEESVLAPHASKVPMWHSDPRFAVLRHLKTFPSLIGSQVLKRMVMDITQANDAVTAGRHMSYAMATSAGMFMMGHAATVIRDAIAGKEPETEVNLETTAEAFSRSGLIGMGMLGIDAVQYAWAGPVQVLMGPTTSKGAALGQDIIRAAANGKTRPLARQIASLVPFASTNKQVRDEMIEYIEEGLETVTWLDKGSSRPDRQDRKDRGER